MLTDHDALGQLLVNALGENAEWVLCWLPHPDANVQVVSTMPPEQLALIFERHAKALRANLISPLAIHEADIKPS